MKELFMNRKARFVIYVIACLFPVVSQLIITLVFVGIISVVEVGTVEYFYKIVTFAVLGITVDAGLYLASRMMRIGFMRDVLLEIRQKAFDKVMGASYEEFGEQSKEVYLSHLTNDINTFENNFFLNLINFIFLVGLAAVSWIILIAIDPLLGSVVTIGGVLILALSKRFMGKTKALQKEVSNQNETLTVGMFNILEGIEVLKLNNVDKQSALRFMKQAKEVEHKKYEFNVYSTKQEKIMQSIGYITFVVTIAYVCVVHGAAMTLAVGSLKIMLVQKSVFSLSQVLPRFNVMMSAVEIYHKIVDRQDDQSSKEQGNPFKLRNEISLDGVSVKYEEQVVLEGVTLTIQKGKKYLVKGVSGAGKSTLMKVLARNRIPSEGEISVDGIPYETISMKSFGEETAFIYQEVFLFEDTIRNNITLYQEYDEDVIQDVAVRSGLTEFMKDGITLDTVLGEDGKNLSGGQKQRIAIARALIKDIQVLFVDEATSALDTATGSEIEGQLLNLPCTVVAISHRYYEGVTEDYDYVLEIQGGKVNKYNAKAYYEEVLVC